MTVESTVGAMRPTEPEDAPAPHMTPREINLAMSGLTLSMFVASLSNLVVLTALPRIVADLHGNQAAYTWIVSASMLTITVCTPIWGRMSDMLNQKRLLQFCVAGYVLSSVCAGFAAAAWQIILCRIGIGVAAAGIIVLMQAIAVEITTPRHRARWVGYRSAVMSVATVGAPTLGGFLAQNFGWRSCFFVGVPIALLSIAMVQKTLRLAPPHKDVVRKMDWPGIVLLSSGIVTVMLWLSVIAPDRGFGDPLSLLALALGALLLAIAIVVEIRSPAPLLPVQLFRQPDIALCAIASLGTGFAFFGSAVYLALYLQIGRGFGPQTAGLMALPEAAATVFFSLLASQRIARHGRYKMALVIGATMICAGFGLLSTISTQTHLVFVGLCVALVGGGLGIVSENLVLIAQTSVVRGKAGSAGALIAFFRMVGGVVCVASMGTLLSGHVAWVTKAAGLPATKGKVPVLALLDPGKRQLVEQAYSSGVALVYFACAIVALVMLVAVALLRSRGLEAEEARP